MRSEFVSAFVREMDAQKPIAERSAVLLQGPVLNDVTTYLRSYLDHELARCGTVSDEIELRRAQGSVAALTDVLALLKHVPVEKRRTTSRHEV